MSKTEHTFFAKAKYLWIVNIVLFVAVVFLGIEQAGRGAEISHLENKIELQIIEKRNLSEEIFSGSTNLASLENAESLGYVKPVQVYYFKTENIFAKLPVQ